MEVAKLSLRRIGFIRGCTFAALAATMLLADRVCAQSDEKTWKYQPSQINHPIPKFDYSDDGRAIMLKRFPLYPEQNFNQYRKYSWVANKNGVQNYPKRSKLKREPNDILSEQQKAILKEWGQPDYLRGSYKSTHLDDVVEWAYHSQNHLFQFVDRTMVYEGPLTDQDRISITYGAPREVMVIQRDPKIRRETWIYRPYVFNRWLERVYSFANGVLVYEQETP